MKLEEVIKNFKFHCKFERNLSNKTMEAYSIDLNQFEQFKDYKNLDISEFDKHKLKDYIQSLYELDFKAKTIKRKVAVLKAFFTYLEFDEIILVSPFRKMRISIKEPTTLPKTMELKEIVKILKFLYKIKESFNDKNLYSYKVIVRDIDPATLIHTWNLKTSKLK